MIGALCRLLLGFTALAVCGIAVVIYGPNPWPLGVLAAGLFVGASVFVARWQAAGIVLARLIGLVSLAGLGLLLVASTIGGSGVRLGQEAQFMALGMGAMAVLGLACFATRIGAGPGR